MVFEPRSALLKNGREVLLRTCTENDIPAFRELVADYLTNSPYIPRRPEEFRPSDDELSEWVNSLNRAKNSFLIIAEAKGKLVGNLDVRGSERQAMAHTGYIGMGLREPFRGIGLGSALMANAVQLARETSALDYLWLQVYEENLSGLSLYRKFGFRECGLQTGFFRHDGLNSNQVTMELHL